MQNMPKYAKYAKYASGYSSRIVYLIFKDKFCELLDYLNY